MAIQGTVVSSRPLEEDKNKVIAQAAQNVRNGSTATANAPQPFTQPGGRVNNTLSQIQDFINGPSFQFTGPQQWSYDADSDPAYQAALSTAKRNIADQQANTNAFLRAGGQGKSSYSESVANQIGSREMARVSDTVLPQLMQQAYQRYSDQANRDMQLQQLNYGVQRDKIGDLANLYAQQYQYDVTRPMDEAQLTGTYLPGEAREAIQNLLGLKQQAEVKGITKEARNDLSKQADGIRAQLSAMGIDPTLYGADVQYNKAKLQNPGFRTLAGQQLDLAGKQANNAAAMGWSELTGHMLYPQNDWSGYQRQVQRGDSPTTLPGQQMDLSKQKMNMDRQQMQWDQQQRMFSNTMQERQFNENVRQFGLEYAMRELQNQQQYGLGLDRQALDEARFGLDMEAAANRGEKANYTMNPKTLMDIISQQYGVQDLATGQTKVPDGMKQQIAGIIGSANMSLEDKILTAKMYGIELPKN
ncbi:hypothetical protein M5X00_30020 [Paenibacillus alvei]|uniref:Uncharacterized protein n=1 Tax=Paenibacillus alvei TaxID=44250 RepID=A0ABT4H1U7_PAEAL|nr:hypothetical protein [Paenibacillus alvei]EJW14460.1 hypothetical protein PAV_13c00790 [Paenibacillus alvei DSM 29]MCY9543717.1 hypothetical protein [Paenibacillus alvei]MCY9708220.1 hypothetical protein [Paenibacillus alvei]MCY9737928.1 hypothetical protein [Paenibacillus alvei]MCY9758460.1 hypothetical protein [Paenibacillus alvei]